MKKTKILFSLLLMLAFVTVILIFGGMSTAAAEAEVTPTITAESKTAFAGEDVEIKIMIDGNPGVGGIGFNLEYDDRLTLKEVVNGTVLKELDFTPVYIKNPCYISWGLIDQVSYNNGVIAILKFKIADGVASGESLNISLSYKSGDIYDYDLQNVYFDIFGGAVNIVDYIPGDVNGDMEIDSKDVTLIRRYIAGYNVIINESAADVTADAEIDSKDVTLIRRYIAGYNVTLLPAPVKHSLSKVDAKSPTCVDSGSIEYWECSDCGKKFNGSDANSVELSWQDIIIPATGEHSYENGVCTVCGASDPNAVYTITFMVDGVAHTVQTKYGETPVFEGSTDKADDDIGRYTFKGWDKDIVPATENTTYTAEYTQIKWRKYNVMFRYNGGALSSIQYVREGTVPVPPDIDKFYNSQTETFTFREWSLPLEPLTAEFYAANKEGTRVIYDAMYDVSQRMYAVNFTIGGEVVYTGFVPYGGKAVYQGPAIKIPAGYKYCGWEGLTDSVTKDNMNVELMFTCVDPYQLEWAYTMDKLSFSPSSTANDNGGNVLGEASAILYMALEIREAPDLTYSAKYRDRAVESLRFMVSDKGSAPFFDLQPYWCYAPLTAAIATCRETPEIWDMLTAEEQEKYDIVMRSFAYVLTLGTADGNNYSTGPGLTGNFGKGWNPNYRLANITPMLFVARYFGGAANVNALLHAFEFEKAIADFEKYPCFDRAYKRWTTTITDENGNPIINPSTGAAYPDAGYFMENGGAAYIYANDARLGYSGVTAGGSGKGVRIDYKYNGFTLDQIDKIMASLLNHNYSGGKVFSDSKALGADGIYPQTALHPILAGTSKAYIIDGTVSPVEGLLGMMLEFNAGDGGNKINGVNTSQYNGKNIRSSASYNLHNFIMIASSISALESLGLYDCDSEANASVYKLMWVGNTDFLYKLEHGYMSYSLGNGYESYEGSGADGYFAWKAWWNNLYADNNPYSDKKETIFSEDYSESAVNATYEKGQTVNGIGYGANGKLGASFVTKDKNGNTYLEIRSTGLSGWDGTGTKPQTDPLANLTPEGGLAEAMGIRTKVTFCMDLARTSNAVFGFQLRLRAVSSADTISIIYVDASGNVSIPSKNGFINIGTLTEEFKTVKVTVDFAAETITGSFGGGGETTAALPLPATASGMSAVEWLGTLNSYIFNWYFSSNNTTTTKELLADNILIYSEP